MNYTNCATLFTADQKIMMLAAAAPLGASRHTPSASSPLSFSSRHTASTARSCSVQSTTSFDQKMMSRTLPRCFVRSTDSPCASCDEIGRGGVAARMRLVRRANAGRRVAAQRHDVTHTGSPVGAHDLIDTPVIGGADGAGIHDQLPVQRRAGHPLRARDDCV